MDAEIKAKLEEMALKQSFYADPAFMAGAQAAWDLAVKHERERNYRLMLTYFGECFDEVIIETPAPPQQGE